jgi:hypothetical protein
MWNDPSKSQEQEDFLGSEVIRAVEKAGSRIPKRRLQQKF